MSKASQQSTRKWIGQRALARAEDATNRKANAAVPPPAPAPHEHNPSSPPPTLVQLPLSLIFERQEAVDALSNLYHNAETVRRVETGDPIFDLRDASKVHEEIMECLKAGGCA
ncbi:hypothetical protein TcG_08458 [Trypanosoma cruzi]|uniref:Uncharacterized protein n=2 Tax=Trypanosoma cruzi TaxID=5693 RepID=V5BLM9_TRYCR|nr:hypothetical protein TCDM_14246 [Trypanosoma cruzi Dm28c]KAF8280880.1 hypothetical protein TcBrA4_0093770 [Trypanosoma cruzi]PBJ71065.1 hypothetical protein BCY84_17398 [Trypanosoma cruzi cruzi]PWU84240.1 hypothetical protein C4B63_242g12c [Trypanosoma cruzi]PWU88284.1 hypothetical protein C4B63_76g487c [Trypanosoma cruzi]